jgi:hypothetical protein
MFKAALRTATAIKAERHRASAVVRGETNADGLSPKPNAAMSLRLAMAPSSPGPS